MFSTHLSLQKPNLFLLLLSLVLTSCGGGSAGNTGQVKFSITDAPVDSAEKVVIHFDSVTLHGPNGNIPVSIVDPVTADTGRDIDLLLLQSGQWTGLFDKEVSAGHYSWIRLWLDLEKSYIQIAGSQYALRCTSCENSGYRINTSFNVEADSTLTMMLDFDLRKSITDPNGSSPDYILRPTVRMVNTAASGAITGNVDPTLITLLGSNNCSVYVFSGHDAQLDDVYIPISDTLPEIQNNPVSTEKVSNIGSYSYTAGFLPEGSYTIAVTCDGMNDSAALNDILTFSEAQNIIVAAGTTTTANFLSP